MPWSRKKPIACWRDLSRRHVQRPSGVSREACLHVRIFSDLDCIRLLPAGYSDVSVSRAGGKPSLGSSSTAGTGSKPMLVLHLALDSAAFDMPVITMVTMQLIAHSLRSLKQMRAVQIPKQVTSSHSGVCTAPTELRTIVVHRTE